MRLVQRAAQQFGAGLSLSDLDRMMDSQYGGAPSYTGKLVSQTTALAVRTVWSCVNALSNDLATLPFMTYQTIDNVAPDGTTTPNGTDRIRNVAPEHYLWGLLLNEANPEMTAWRFQHLMQTWVLLWGNAFAEIEISGRGQVTALWPWRPDRVTVSRQYEGGPLQYAYRMRNGNVYGPISHTRMFHLRGLSIDGVMGLSPIEVHKQTVGLSAAVTEHGARYFGQGARPLGIFKHPKQLGDIAYQRLKQEFEKRHEGLANAHRFAILEEGMDWKDTGSNMVDAQYIETQNLTQEDIAAIYNMPQHRVGLLARSTNNNITQQAIEYIIYTLMPWAENWQQQIGQDCLSPRERKTISIRANYKYLLRGDFEAMSKFITAARQNGVETGDEIRDELLDQNPLPNGAGKKVWRPANMTPEGEGTEDPNLVQVVAPVRPVEDEPKPAPAPLPPPKKKTFLNGRLN